MPNQKTGPVTGDMVQHAINESEPHCEAVAKRINTMLAAQAGGGITDDVLTTAVHVWFANINSGLPVEPGFIERMRDVFKFFLSCALLQPASTPAKPLLVFTGEELSKKWRPGGHSIIFWDALAEYINRRIAEYYGAGMLAHAAGFTLATPPAPQPQSESVTVRIPVHQEGGCLNIGWIRHENGKEFDAVRPESIIAYITARIPIRKPEEVAGEVSGP